MSETTSNTYMVYRHTSPSGKVYIGISKNSPAVRWGRNGSGYLSQPYFSNAILKYGWDNIKHEVLFTNLPETKAKQLEMDLIRHYKNLGISYNITDGGDGTVGWHPSEELKKQWSESRKGRIIDEEWKQKISESLMGRIIPRETIEKAVKRSIELRSLCVVKITLDGRYVEAYHSIRDAAVSLGSARINSDIIKCCKGIKRSCHNYLWMYKDSYDSFVAEGTINDKIAELVIAAQNKHKYLKEESHIRKLRAACKEAKSKPVLQITLDGINVAVFSCGKDVERAFGWNASFIGGCCNGKYEKAYGYKWKYITKEEYNEYKRVLDAA